MARTASPRIVRQKLTQIVVMIIVILAGIVLTQPAEANPVKRKRSSVTKKVSLKNNSGKACYILYKKRTESRNRSVMASATRKPKYKPMAETDSPVQVASME